MSLLEQLKADDVTFLALTSPQESFDNIKSNINEVKSDQTQTHYPGLREKKPHGQDSDIYKSFEEGTLSATAIKYQLGDTVTIEQISHVPTISASIFIILAILGGISLSRARKK